MKEFYAWKDKVDEVLTNTVGILSSGLADVPYYAYFQAGMTPLAAAQAAVNNEYGKRAPTLQYRGDF